MKKYLVVQEQAPSKTRTAMLSSARGASHFNAAATGRFSSKTTQVNAKSVKPTLKRGEYTSPAAIAAKKEVDKAYAKKAEQDKGPNGKSAGSKPFPAPKPPGQKTSQPKSNSVSDSNQPGKPNNPKSVAEQQKADHAKKLNIAMQKHAKDKQAQQARNMSKGNDQSKGR